MVMYRLRSLALILLSILAVSRPAASADSRAFVLTSDYFSGGLRRVSLDTRTVLPGEASVSEDAVLRWYDGLIYVVNRTGPISHDNIQIIDPATLTTLHQFSTGAGSNPQDIAFASPTKAYVTRYELADLLVMNPTDGATITTISLAAFADADGIPEMARMIRVERWLFVALQRLDRAHSFAPTESSLVAVIDTEADTVVDVDPALPGKQAIVLQGKNPVTTFGFDRATTRLLIGCAGVFRTLDGGIEWIDPVNFRALGVAITEAALGGDIGDVAWNGPDHSYAIVNDASFNASLVSWSATSGTKLATVFSPGDFSLPDCELDDRGELYVCDNKFTAPGLFAFSTPNDQVLAGPLDTGLAPVQVTFDRVSDQVTSVTPFEPEAAFSAAWPNPARAEARFGLSLARAGEVRIEAFDVSGRRVRTLARGERPAGSSEVAWDLRDEQGRRVEPGLYLVRARLGDSVRSRRIVVVR